MNAYDRARQDGAPPQQAMYSAAQRVFGGRQHGATPWWWAAGALPVVDNELEQLFRSAGQLDPVARGRWLRGLEQRGWSPESIAWAEAMLTRSDDHRRTAAAAAATVDDPETPVDERAGALDTAVAATGRADDLAMDAAAVAGTADRTASFDPAAPAGGAQVAGPVRLARASFATPASAVLRRAVSPPAAPGRQAHEPDRASRRGRTR